MPEPAPEQDLGWASPDPTATTRFAPGHTAPPAHYPGVPPLAPAPATWATPATTPGFAAPGAPTAPAAPYFGPPAHGQPYSTQPQGQAYSAYVTPPPPPSDSEVTGAARKRKLILRGAIGAVVVLALIAVGIYALLPGRTGNSVVAKVNCRPADLASCLIKAPDGAVLLTSTDNGPDSWPKQTTTTASLYGANITDDTVGVNADTETMLESDHVAKIVHTDWNAVDGDDVDLVLLGFTSQKGAQAWNSTRTAEIAAAYQGESVAIPADTTSKAYANKDVDRNGFYDAAYSTVVGTVVLNVAYSSPKQFSAADLETWAGTELASLRTAPAAAADPADVAPGQEQVACATMSSCLMPTPYGGKHWTSPINKDWVSSSSLSVKQYVKLEWNDDVQTVVTSNFTVNGVTSIGHEDWTTDGGDKQADIYLIQTVSAVGAKALAAENFIEPGWAPGLTGVAYSIPGDPDAQAWYTNKKDPQGFTDVSFTEVVGNVIVDGYFFFYGSFDSATSNSWTESELNQVSRTAASQPVGLDSLTPPTLPAASQGTCSGDCLLPLPAGATDTTSLSYFNGVTIDAPTYTSKYESNMDTDMATWLAADGFATASHRAWTVGNGATADEVLLSYKDPSQAKAAAALEYGANLIDDRVCTDSAVPDSYCLAMPVDTSDPLLTETVWVLAWKGEYEVSIRVTTSNSADVADAYTWAQQQLDLLPAAG